MAAEEQLISDSSKAPAELIRRIRALIQNREGLLLVETTLGPGLSVLPSTSPWAVNCGAGITAVFGSSVSGGAESVDSDIKVLLTYVIVSKQSCEKLAVIVAQEIQAIVNGR